MVARLAQEIIVSNMTGLAELFRARGAPVPAIIWSPDPDLSGYPLERGFAAICKGFARGDGTLDADILRLDAFGRMADWLSVLKSNAEGVLYYDYIGRGYMGGRTGAAVGKPPESIPGIIGLYLAATCRAATLRRESLLTVHRPVGQRFASTWRRTIVPMICAKGEMGCLVLNCAANDLGAGLEVVPAAVLIVDADMTVRHANKAARVLFDQGTLGSGPVGLFEFSGLDLTLDQSPDDILASGINNQMTVRHVSLQRIGRYHVTVSAMTHFGTAHYVLLVQRPGDLDR